MLKRKRNRIILLCALAVLMVSWGLWATRSQNLWDPSHGKVVYAQIIFQYEDPDAVGGGVSIWHSMDTESPAQVAELVSLVSRYPYNRKADFSKIFGPRGRAIYSPLTTMKVSVTCGAQNGKNYWAEEYVCSDGSMEAAVSDGKLFPCAVGRFGTARTEEYCTQLKNFFDEKTKNPDWKTGQNITEHPWRAEAGSASSGAGN